LHDIIVEAGKISLEYQSRLSELSVEYKTKDELVSEADRAVEKFLRTEINHRYPKHGILGEEQAEKAGDQYRWVIDPIDGTTSFVNGQPFYGISIGLEKSGETILAAVNLPAMDELFEAQKGRGAYCNGKGISVSRRSDLSKCVLVSGFAALRGGLSNKVLNNFCAVMRRIWSVRVLGSAAMDLCYVACGRMDGFWELGLKPYDVAAGLLIVAEAQGRYSDYSGRTDNIPHEVIATNGLIHDEMIRILAEDKANQRPPAEPAV